MTDNQRNFTERDSLGRFAKGNSGRPYGSKNKASREVLNKVKAMEEGAIQKLWEAVCLGEQWAVTFVLSKLLPNGRTIELEGLTTKDLQDALTCGDISPEEGRTLATILRNLNEIESFDEIKEKLEELESMVKGNEF